MQEFDAENDGKDVVGQQDNETGAIEEEEEKKAVNMIEKSVQ